MQIDGEFYYYVKNESATILGLVSEGKEREELVIPETLGGYPVKQIGAFSASIGSSIKYYGIDATIYRNYESSEKIDGKYIAANNIQINVELEEYYDFNLFCYEQANDIKYEAMGGNLRTFHTIVRDGCYLNLPQDPVRDGYNFAGWFKEEECLNEWNFDEDIVEEDITLYAKWIEV